MPERLMIALAPERLEEGTPEERAAFGRFAITANNIALTEGFDHFIDGLRDGPLVSGYHAAEWFAWNWWRLMYEPYRRASPQWGLAHRLPAIGAGYVWPNIEIRSDGQRAVLISRPSSRPDAKPFRFLGAASWLGPCEDLEGAIDGFVPQVLARVSSRVGAASNLQALWDELLEERRDPEIARRRRLEALMGLDPGDAEDALLDRLVAESQAVGADALDELAANAPEGMPVQTDELRQMSMGSRLISDRREAARLPAPTLTAIRREPLAWRQGKRAAEELRRREGLGSGPVSTERLMTLIGASGEVEASIGPRPPLSFMMQRRGATAGIVLRSAWATGRRFDLARLLGDVLLFGGDAVLSPATQAYTFRQKAQRSFAAEFLAPFEAAAEALGDDLGKDSIEEVARLYDVSPLTIETLLMNNGRLDRELTADAA